MSQFIEQLESREYMSTVSLSNPTYLDIKPTDSIIAGTVNKARKEQIYMIRVTKAGLVNLRLEGLTGDATLQLINDKNHNNRLDSGEVVQQSAKILAADESISRMMAVGNYQVRVLQAEGNAIINYTLRYSTNPFAASDQEDKTGNDSADARDFSVPMNANRTVNEYVGNGDTADVYKLVVTETTKYDIRLSGLVKDADVTLSDANGNTLYTTAGLPQAKKLISGKLEAGTYYLTVTAVSDPTGYSLRVVGSAVRSTDVDLTSRRIASNPFSRTPINVVPSR